MYTPFAFSRTVKFALVALFGIVLVSSAHAAAKYTTMTDLGGKTVSINLKSDQTIKDVFSSGAGITNGTLNVKYPSGVWGTISGLNFTIAKDAILNFNPSGSGNVKDGELNIKDGSIVTLDGGTFNNNNSRTSDFNDIGNDGTDGTLRIIRGGKFTGTKTSLQIGNKQGSTGILSVDDGTVDVGSNYIYVAPNQDGNTKTTGILAVTNGVVKSNNDIALCEKNSGIAKLSFVDSKLTISRIRKTKDPTSGSFCIMDGCTINSTYKEMLSSLNSIPYQLEGKGLIANPSVDSAMYGTYVSHVTDRGPGPIVKKGPKTVTFKGEFTGSADLRVDEGVFAIDSTATLPDAGVIALTISGTGAFEGLDQTATYKSLTLGEDAVLPVAFENGEATTFKAAETIVTATADHPVTIAGTGTLTVNTVIAEGLTVTDASLFVLSGVAGSLKIEDGKLIAVKPSRPVDTLTWAKGSEGDNWSGTDNWTYGDPATATTFQSGDSALFATAGDKAVVDSDVMATKVEFKADATVTGTATLATTNLTVDAGVKATIAASLSEDIEKTGEGELVLRDYADGKALDLTEGKVSLVWSEEPESNPFSMEMDANSIAGVLDLGGAKQTLAGNVQNNSGIFRNGGEVRHGEIEVDPSSWLNLKGITDFTVGEGANVYFKKYDTNTDGTRNRGQLNMYNAYLRIAGEGARFAVMNERTTQDASKYNSYGKIGSSGGDATVEVGNGGTFAHEKRCLILGWDPGITGAIVGDGGNVTVGAQELFIGYNGAAMLALTNSTLTAKYVNLGWSKQTPGKQTMEFVGGTTVKVAGFKKNAVHNDSSILFDDATLVPTAAGSFLPDLGIPATIGANGLIISNDCDVTVAAPLAGEGKLTKKGAGVLTFSGVQSFEGGLEVCAGSIGSTLTADGFATQNLDLSLNLSDGEKVRLDIAGTPEPGVDYTLFKSGITEETLPRLEIDANYELSLEDGQLKVKLSPLSLTWTGEGENMLWSTVANWRDAPRGPAKFDTVIFDGESGDTEYDLENGLLLKEIEVNSGAWTTKVDNACFAGVPVQVETGALFALTGAKGKSNPFSTAKDANTIAGVLDLGGAKQTLAGNVQNSSGIFRNGGEVRHGEIEVDPSSWLNLNGITDFTVGEGANVYFKKYDTNTDGTRNRGQLNMYNAHLRIVGEGARFAVMNERTTQDGSKYNSYGKIGSSGGDATVEVGNGGTFAHEKRCLILGWDPGITGAIVGDGGNVTVKGQELFLGYKGAAVLALTNSTLTADSIKFGWSGQTPGKQTVELINSTATIGQIGKNQTLADGSSVVFDGATIVDNHGATALLQDLGIPYTIAEGGLTVKVANRTADDDYVSFPGTFEGEGDFILVAAGKTPRVAKFTGGEDAAEKGFAGNLVVSNGVTVVAGGKTFKGGLYACEGSTLNVATSVFEGNVTIEAGVKFTDVPDPTAELSKPVVLLQTKGTITSALLDSKSQDTKNRYYVRTRGEINELCYGRKPGVIISIN